MSALFGSLDSPFNEGLAQAAFWQFVRQDIYMSLPKRQTPRTSTMIQPPLTNDRTIPDCHWANRIVWSTLAIMSLCFRDESPDVAAYENYSQRVKDWYENKPISFTPMYYRGRSVVDGRYFPEIWLSDPWHGGCPQFCPDLSDLAITDLEGYSHRVAILSPLKDLACSLQSTSSAPSRRLEISASS